MSNTWKKAFTLTEMIVVITIIGILMMGMTAYIGGSGEKTKIIEAQGCATTLGGKINNYVYYALTSKSLKIDNTTTVSPDFYVIGLSEVINDNIYKNIVFSYITGDNSPSEYQTVNVGNSCRNAQPNLGFYRSGDSSIDYVKMNKGFSPISINEMKVFYLQNDTQKDLQGDIIIVMCRDANCSTYKQVAKWAIDGRSQTISLKKCIFYQENDSSLCDEREL